MFFEVPDNYRVVLVEHRSEPRANLYLQNFFLTLSDLGELQICDAEPQQIAVFQTDHKRIRLRIQAHGHHVLVQIFVEDFFCGAIRAIVLVHY